MSNFAVIDTQNVVVNTIVWDGDSLYTPAEGTTLIRSETAKIGDVWNGQVFISQELHNA